MTKTLAAFLLFLAAPLVAQCVKQPSVALKGVDEFACRGMSYEQAWDTLTTGGVAPVRPIRVAEMGMKSNYGSRKQILSRGLQILGFATGIVAAYFSENLQGWQIGALAAGPAVVDQSIKWAAGEPDEFTQLPDDNGFTTIYALATNQQIVGRPAPAVSTPASYLRLEPPPAFTPTHWSVLLAETQIRCREFTERNRQAEIAWRAEWKRHERESFMNESETLEFIESYWMVAAK